MFCFDSTSALGFMKYYKGWASTEVNKSLMASMSLFVRRYSNQCNILQIDQHMKNVELTTPEHRVWGRLRQLEDFETRFRFRAWAFQSTCPFLSIVLVFLLPLELHAPALSSNQQLSVWCCIHVFAVLGDIGLKMKLNCQRTILWMPTYSCKGIVNALQRLVCRPRTRLLACRL